MTGPERPFLAGFRSDTHGEMCDNGSTNEDGPGSAASTAGNPQGLADSTLRSVD